MSFSLESIPAPIIFVALALCLTLSALVSAMETAFTGVSKSRLMALSAQGDTRADRVLQFIEAPERFMSAFLLANNVLNTFAATATTAAFSHQLGDNGLLYITGLVAMLVVIYSEILPKSITLANPNNVALKLIFLAQGIVFICYPLVLILQQVINIVMKLLRMRGTFNDASMQMAREELRGAIDLSHSEGGVQRDEKERLGGLLNLRDLDVSEVMIHRKNITVMDVRESAEKLVRQILATPYTRIPLYRDNPENIVGVLHAKDILRAVVRDAPARLNDLKVASIMRKPWFIPDTTSVADQLNRFLARRNHFAVVVDEYGALQGLVTLEDILEEIVGDIRDEHDANVVGVRPQSDGAYLVDGKTHIRDFNRRASCNLPDTDATTMAGLVIHAARCIPERGQVFRFFGCRFEIIERQRNQITAIKVYVDLE